MLSVIISIAFLLSRTRGFGTGSGTCSYTNVLADATAGGMTSVTRNELVNASAEFTVAILTSPIQPGQVHTITINRTTGSGGFTGLLLFLEDNGGNRIGTFVLTAESGTTAKALTTSSSPACPGPGQTLTHSSTAGFAANEAFMWTAPSPVNGPVTIYAVAYQSPTFNKITPLVVPAATVSPTTSTPTTTPSKSPTSSPTASPTVDVLSVCSTASPPLLDNGQLINIQFAASRNDMQAAFTVIGSSTAWYGIGFGTSMITSTAFIAQTAQQVQVFAITQQSYPSGFANASSSINYTIISDVTANSRRTLCVLLDSNNAGGINLSGPTADVVFAVGNSAATLSPGGHGPVRRNKTTVEVAYAPPTMAPSSSPATSGPTAMPTGAPTAGAAPRLGGMFGLVVGFVLYFFEM